MTGAPAAATATEATDRPQTPHPLYEGGMWVWEKNYPEGISWRAPILKKPLHYILDHAAEKYGEEDAVDFLGKTWTYRDLAGLASKAARGLQALGVGKGVKVGLFLPNTPYALVFYYGILKAGGTVVNYNPLYVEKELENQIEDSETDIMITVDLKMLVAKMDHMLHNTRLKKVVICPFADALPFPKNLLFRLAKAKDIARTADDPRYIRLETLLDNDGNPAPVTVDPAEDVAVLQYTGGTTGVPKGAMLTHGNVFANVMQTTLWVRGAEPYKDSMIGVLPFFHVFAMTVVMNWSVWNGVKIFLQPKYDVNDVMKLIGRRRPSFFPAVPAIFNAIATHPDVARYDFSSLKFCLSGGAPLPGDVKRLFEEKTGSKAIAEGYGLTESSPVAAVNPVGGRVKTGTVGQPLPGTIIEIINPETGAFCGVGEKGEVCIAGPQVMKGYYRRPEATSEVIRNGRLHTGDVGFVDADGYLTLVDRIKDLILVRGYNVYPRIVEEAIYLHPSVEECIVAGVPDAERGETVWAWVKPVSGRTVTEGDLMEFLKDKLNPIEYPRKIVIRNQPLPKTAVGKLSRKDLLAQEGITRK